MSITKKIAVLKRHNVPCTIQDGELWAVDDFTMAGHDGLLSEWKCLEGVNILIWLGY